MSEQIIHTLEKITNKTYDLLSSFQIQVMEAVNHLKALPELFKKLLESINEGFSRQIEALYESQIYIRLANLTARKSQVLVEQQAISDFKAELFQDLEEIKERYARFKSDIIKQKESSEKVLDAHLYNLNDLFPERMFKADQQELKPLIDILELEAKDSYIERAINHKEISENTRNTVQGFINSRNEFFKKVREYTHSGMIEEKKEYYLPIILLEVTDEKTNETKNQIIPSFNINFETNSSINLSNSEIIIDNRLNDFNEYLNQDQIKSFLFKQFEWTRSSKTKSDLADEVTKFYENSFNENSLVSIKKSLKDALDSSDLQSI